MSCREAVDCEYLWKSKSDLVKYHTFLVLIAIQPISGVLSIEEEKSNTSQDVSMIITAPSPPSSLLNADILQTIYSGHLSNHYSSMLQGMKLAPAHVHHFWSKNCSFELAKKGGTLERTMEYPNVKLRYSFTCNCLVPLFPIVFYECLTVMRVVSSSFRKLYTPLRVSPIHNRHSVFHL